MVVRCCLNYLYITYIKIKEDNTPVLDAISADLCNHTPEQVEKFLNVVQILAEKIDEM